ncbi:MAG: helix-turn-helix domain-containing protein [Nakamurella sp.]
MASADLLLHPLRLRIVQSFLGDRQLTTGQLLAELVDIPPATLYRQVATLAKAGVLLVVDERPIRGTVERTYALSLQDAQVDADDLRKMTPDDHRRAFMSFIAGLLADFDSYLESGDIDLERDGAGYRGVALWLTDDELTGLVGDIGAAVQSRARNTPVAGRRRRMLSTILIPQVAVATPTADDGTANSGAGGESGQDVQR